MNPEIVYYEVKSKSTVKEKILDYAKNHSNWITYEEFTYKDIENFYEDFVKNDDFLKKLYDKLPFIGALLHIKPFSVYDWHIDTNAKRHTGINMILTDESRCHTLFSLDRGKIYVKACTFVELQYKPNTYYLLNTDIQHMVTNFESDRFLFTMSFKDSNVTYFDALKVILEIEQ